MTLPAHLLNANASVYRESNTPGQFGQVQQSLVLVGSSRCRMDQKRINRLAQSGNFEQTAGYFRVYLPDSWAYPIETKFWVRVVTDSGIEILGQVDSVANPGMMGHHMEIDIIKRQPGLPIPA